MKRIFLLVLILISTFIIFKSFASQDKFQRDPLFPLVSPEGRILNVFRNISLSEIRLEAIIYSPRNPCVIINDNIYKQGDRIGEYEIVKINEDKVLLKKGKRSFELILYEKILKKEGEK